MLHQKSDRGTYLLTIPILIPLNTLSLHCTDFRLLLPSCGLCKKGPQCSSSLYRATGSDRQKPAGLECHQQYYLLMCCLCDTPLYGNTLPDERVGILSHIRQLRGTQLVYFGTNTISMTTLSGSVVTYVILLSSPTEETPLVRCTRKRGIRQAMVWCFEITG